MINLKQCWQLFNQLPSQLSSDSVDVEQVDETLKLLLRLIEAESNDPVSSENKRDLLLQLQLWLQRNTPVVETQRAVVAEQITELNTRRKINQHYLKNV